MSVKLHHLKNGQWKRRVDPDPGVVIWDGNLSALIGEPVYEGLGPATFLPKPWPYSSIQSEGNKPELGRTGFLSVDPTVSRNEREGCSLKIAVKPFTQRCQVVARGGPNELPPFQGRWTPTEDGNDNDIWYGWSMLYGEDWGSGQQLIDEITTTFWHAPMGWRGAIPNGSMNVSGDQSDSNGIPGQVVTATPKMLYLRRNTVSFHEGYYTDGLGLDKIPMGEVVVGEWMDFVVHIKWSTTGLNALTEVWRDGKFMGRSTALNAREAAEHWFRPGMYQEENIPHWRTMWYSNCRMGTSYDAVDPTKGV